MPARFMRRLASLGLAVVVAFGLAACTAQDIEAILTLLLVTPTPPPAAAGDWYQLFFTTPRYPDDEAYHYGGPNEPLAGLINMAQKSVDMAAYQLDLPDVTQALIAARQRGATVRVVTDIDMLNDDQENPPFKQLRRAGIPVRGGNPNAIMHNKFVVVDEAVVWTGSWNFTLNDTYRYDNNSILIRSSRLARNYTATFEKMFQDGQFGPQREAGGVTHALTVQGVTLENYFAPEDKPIAHIAARLEKAQTSIDFMAYAFTDDDLGQILRDRARAGVKVRGVFEKSGSETPYSEYAVLKKAGLDVWQDGNPYLMHHKVFILDGQTVILGSFNFSRNANESNDENLLIVDDAGLAQAFAAEFERVLAQAQNPPHN